jgi:hypothetical protein
LQIYRTLAGRRYRRDKSILAALASLDADDIRIQIAEQGRAVRSGDVTAEIQNAHSGKNTCVHFHDPIATSMMPPTIRTA